MRLRSFRSFIAIAILCSVAIGGVVPVQAQDVEAGAVGGGGAFAALADARRQSQKLMEEINPSKHPPGSFEYHMERYNTHFGGPYLYSSFRIELFQIIDHSAIRSILYLAYVLVMAFAVMNALSRAKSGKGSFDELGVIIAKCLVGGILASKTMAAMIYAILMTIQSCATSVLDPSSEDGISASVLGIINTAGINMMAVENAKIDGIKDAYEQTATALVNSDNMANLRRVATRMNSLADTYNSKKPVSGPEVKKVSDAALAVTEAEFETLKAEMRESLNSLLMVGSNYALEHAGSLGNVLKIVDRDRVPRIQQLATTPDNAAHLQTHLGLYRDAIRDRSLKWVREEVIEASAAGIDPAGAAGFSAWWKATWDSGIRNVAQLADNNIMLTVVRYLASMLRRFIAFAVGSVVEAVSAVSLEITLMILIFVYPFWMFDGTKQAFTGAFKSLIGLTFYLPMFQFGCLLLDLFTAGLLKRFSLTSLISS